ncbi:MAG: hypothetical protein ACKOYN_03965 [Planctomycetota bacterium]
MRIRTLAVLPAALLALVMAAMAAPRGPVAPSAPQDSAQTAGRVRSSASTMVIELNGKTHDLLSAEGGVMVGSVQVVGGVKSVGKAACQPLVVKVPGHVAPTMLELHAKGEFVSGAVVNFDAEGKPVRRHEFSNALITEISLGALDASSKDALTATVVLEPASSVVRSGKDATGKRPAKDEQPKSMLRSNFRITIDGQTYPRTVSLGAIESKSARKGTAIGKAGTAVDSPNLKIVLSALERDALEAWYRETVLEGRGSNKPLRVEMLDGSMKNVLFALESPSVGILSLRDIDLNAQAARIEVELCVNGWNLVRKAG